MFESSKESPNESGLAITTDSIEKVGEWANQRRSLNESLSDMVKVNDSNLSYTKSEMY